MKQRFDLSKTEPRAYKAMAGLEEYLKTTALTNIQKELIKIRASQINGCAFCLDMHTKDALKYGETQQRIFLLNAWRETDLYSDEEKAILALTEEITLISQKGLSEETYQWISKYFNENEIAQIIMAVITINAWNRIAISTHTPVPKG
ncbi:alkylhydroperoxidase like protein, AhpD family [Pseudopedobacter saltans DSM 12145]|uniref:Alkylhydroperoxidase like protein, AhpD family n=1 Tax=Pseudopedobacter saltans (strain ATCC 51119 / DSM 12145 / JCM 21818 / CCUG 39354 / LMG 10337 / NBRC 100064 / NCIMB 13643) TaxID=762903 RepID=F0S6I7_PSESL|nr:carboxymuconolactone decarboxylase family protein [Pseudopedobacter saltans]ADY51063.1 alkylhydroperoxidase like protein, AhpD family [Pseudopedobacter saltans DSM 12145]